MSDLHCNSEIISDTAQGSILCISFSGYYPPGSQGTPTAEAMRAYTTSERTKHRPAAVLYDLTDLDYVWGDGIISQLLFPMWREDKQRGVECPACFVAQGSTREAVQNLLDCCGVLRFINTKVVESKPAAIEHLQTALQE
jgi:hypothetical protein